MTPTLHAFEPLHGKSGNRAPRSDHGGLAKPLVIQAFLRIGEEPFVLNDPASNAPWSKS